MKKCTKCHRLKPLSDFYKDKHSFAKRLIKSSTIWQKKNKDKVRQ